MPRLLFISLFLFLSFSVVAQEEIILEGKIQADSIMEASVHVVNLTQETGTVNLKDGSFRIRVQENDTLFFSSIQFEVQELIITSEIFQKAYVEIVLVPIELEEVKISDINLSGNLNIDAAEIKTINQADFGLPYLTKPRPTQTQRRLYTASSGPIDLLVNSLNGNIKRLKKIAALEAQYQLVQKGMKILPENFFTEELGLEEWDIINFVYYCAEIDAGFKTMVNKGQPLDLLEYYQEKLPPYIEMREGERGEIKE